MKNIAIKRVLFYSILRTLNGARRGNVYYAFYDNFLMYAPISIKIDAWNWYLKVVLILYVK